MQWFFAADLLRVNDWQQTAFALYMVAVGALASLSILPGLIADDRAGR